MNARQYQQIHATTPGDPFYYFDIYRAPPRETSNSLRTKLTTSAVVCDNRQVKVRGRGGNRTRDRRSRRAEAFAMSALQDCIRHVVSHQHLSLSQARDALGAILDGRATGAQIGAFLTALRMKGETAEEIAGLALAVRERAVDVPCDTPGIVEICGTGGGSVRTFSISTGAAIVAAACDVPIAKQVSGPVAGHCGSSGVLRELGVDLSGVTRDPARCLQEAGLAFLYAPAFHPSMRHVVQARAEIGLRTVFNLLGPLTNPAGASRFVVGVAGAQYTELIATALHLMGSDHALVVHGMVGMDEISTFGDTQVTEVRNGDIHSALCSPEQYGIATASAEALAGDTPEQSAATLASVLEGQEGPAADIVTFNAAAAIYVGGKAADIQEGILVARDAIKSGAAMARLAVVREICRSH